MYMHVVRLETHVASFPDSTPLLFIHSAIKSRGVESGNEARLEIGIWEYDRYSSIILHVHNHSFAAIYTFHLHHLLQGGQEAELSLQILLVSGHGCEDRLHRGGGLHRGLWEEEEEEEEGGDEGILICCTWF